MFAVEPVALVPMVVAWVALRDLVQFVELEMTGLASLMPGAPTENSCVGIAAIVVPPAAAVTVGVAAATAAAAAAVGVGGVDTENSGTAAVAALVAAYVVGGAIAAVGEVVVLDTAPTTVAEVATVPLADAVAVMGFVHKQLLVAASPVEKNFETGRNLHCRLNPPNTHRQAHFAQVAIDCWRKEILHSDTFQGIGQRVAG